MSAPQDLDDDSLRRLARSFYVVRMARYAGLLAASLAIGVLAAAQDAPAWVPVALAVLALAFVVAMARTRQRYLSSRRADAPSSPSPTG